MFKKRDVQAPSKKKGKLVLVISGLLVTNILAFAYSSQRQFEESLVEEFQHHQLTILRGASKGIRGALVHVSTALERLAKEPAVKSGFAAGYAQPFKRTMEELEGMVRAVYRLDTKGVIQMRYPFAKERIGQKIPDSPLLERALGSRGAVLVGPFQPIEGRYTVSVIAPITRDGVTVGAVRALVDLQTLGDEFVAPLGETKNSYAFISDATGVVLYHPGGDYEGRPWSKFDNMEGGLPWVEKGYTEGSSQHSSVDLKELVAFSPVQVGGDRLMLVLVSPRSDIAGPIKRQKRRTWAFVVVLLAIVAPGVYKYTEMRGRRAFLERENALSEMVRASEKRYRTLVESSLDSVTLLDLKGKIIASNKAADWALQPGVRESLEGKSLVPFYPEGCQFRVEVALDRVQQGEVAVVQLFTYTSTNAVRWWECSFIPVQDDAGRVEHILATARDISDRKQAEEKLKETRRYLGSLIESSTDAIISTDAAGNVLTFSKGAEALLGYNRQEVVGRYVTLLYGGEEKAKEIMRYMRQGGGSVSAYETALKAKDGQMIPVLISASLLYDDDGEVVGSVGFSKDLRERKRAEQVLAERTADLARSNAELEEFARVASHDLQEPLRKVKAFGDRLEAKCGDALGPEGLDYLERMLNATERMQTLITSLLSYSRVTTKAQPFTQVDLSRVARDVLSDLEARIERTCGRVELGELPTIEADQVQMRQLLQNLISNALKFHKPGEPPVVRVSGAVENGREAGPGGPAAASRCRIVVEDNGIGFDQVYSERIFGVFQRLHGRNEYDGSGIGLAVCRKIAERHRGSITADSEPGRGATFVATLPVKQSYGENDHERG